MKLKQYNNIYKGLIIVYSEHEKNILNEWKKIIVTKNEKIRKNRNNKKDKERNLWKLNIN